MSLRSHMETSILIINFNHVFVVLKDLPLAYYVLAFSNLVSSNSLTLYPAHFFSDFLEKKISSWPDISLFQQVSHLWIQFIRLSLLSRESIYLMNGFLYLFISAYGYILKSTYIYFYRHYAKCERSATRPVSQAYCSFNHTTSIVLLFLLFPFHFHYGGRKKCSTIIRAVKYDTFPPRTLVFQF